MAIIIIFDHYTALFDLPDSIRLPVLFYLPCQVLGRRHALYSTSPPVFYLPAPVQAAPAGLFHLPWGYSKSCPLIDGGLRIPLLSPLSEEAAIPELKSLVSCEWISLTCMSVYSSCCTVPAPSHSSQVTPILKTLSTSNMQSYLSTLTSYNNRYYTSSTGKAASQWIFDTITQVRSPRTVFHTTVSDTALQLAADRDDITVTKFNHSWQQFSVVAHIPGKSSGALTVLGAHEDSINLNSPSSGRAPGADDDGSGTVNLIEIFRALVAADFQPSTPVEFHWYSGEEAGLLGSQDIAKNYKSKGTSIKAFLELDMTAYFAPGSKEVIALEADYIDSGLTSFLKQLVDAYSTLDWAMDTAVSLMWRM